MTSAVMSSQSADEESSAGALSEDGISRQLLFTSSWCLELPIAKRCRSNKLERQRFAFALRFSRWFLQRWIQQKRKYKRIQKSRKMLPVASKLQRYESSRSDEPVAKQLTIYEELSKLDVNC
ncbi:hypothetical protein F511_19721 [Dorcoceras hygrometricum]|uniref:Uncharacterized protein n=1 Tax=Dorcoceras hygrometricum TaxID=472368 RepID=A0A2Z7CVQ8_9LAMI|nr:hypothetical protein F511_19721 [Dorcoceras hygrometricum]